MVSCEASKIFHSLEIFLWKFRSRFRKTNAEGRGGFAEGAEGGLSPLRVVSHCVFDCECGCRFLCSRCRDDDNADEDEHGSENGAEAEGFAGQEISEQHGNDRIDVGVSADFGWRFVMEEPYVGRESDDGTGDDEIDEREPRCSGYGRRMETLKFSERS